MRPTATEEFPAEDTRRPVSVVIPTHNRCAQLTATLQALTRQSIHPLEVIVVDDGSTDNTSALLSEWTSRRDLPFLLRHLKQTNQGPAQARNQGVQASTGDFIFFLGDDTIPDFDWLAAHLKRQQNAQKACAVVGYTKWDDEHVRVTPFLNYINHAGPQFAYDNMRPGEEAPYTSFYTSNLSLPRHWLIKHPFSGHFRAAMWEDSELGYRLHQNGLPIIYEPGAVTRHRHPTDMKTFLQRIFRTGVTVYDFIGMHPELADRFTYRGSPAAWLLKRTIPLWLGLTPLAAKLDRAGIPLPRILYSAITGAAYFRGLREGKQRAFSHAAP